MYDFVAEAAATQAVLFTHSPVHLKDLKATITRSHIRDKTFLSLRFPIGTEQYLMILCSAMQNTLMNSVIFTNLENPEDWYTEQTVWSV